MPRRFVICSRIGFELPSDIVSVGLDPREDQKAALEEADPKKCLGPFFAMSAPSQQNPFYDQLQAIEDQGLTAHGDPALRLVSR
jgi:hypothetical protein